MARRPIGPWYWTARGAYFGTVAGKRVRLAVGPEGKETLDQAWADFHRLEIQATPDPRIKEITAVLTARPELIPDVLRLIAGETTPAKLPTVGNLPTDPAPTDEQRLTTLIGAALLVDWNSLLAAIRDDKAGPGVDRFIDREVTKDNALYVFDQDIGHYSPELWIVNFFGEDTYPVADRLEHGLSQLREIVGVRFSSPDQLPAALSGLAKLYPILPPTDETTLATLIREFRRINWNSLLADIRDERADPRLDQWVDQNQVRESGMYIFQNDIGTADIDRWTMYMFGRDTDPTPKRLSRAYRELPDALGIKATRDLIPAALMGLAKLYPATEL